MKLFNKVATIERCAANALPSPIVKTFEGWRLRYAYGVTRRANSVLAETHEGSLEDKLEAVEQFYTYYNASPRFQLCPASQPEDLESILLNRGYTKVTGAFVQTLALNTFKFDRDSDRDSLSVELLNKPNNDWFRIYRAVEKASPDKEKVRTWMLENIAVDARFALCYIDQKPASVGLGVLEHNHIGLFNMATLEDFRGLGGASTIVTALATWAKKERAHTMYLQVATQNNKAQGLYKHLGFSTLYEYCYLELV